MFSNQSNKGFGLLEVMIAAGLMVGLAMGIAHMASVAQKANKGSQLNQDAQLLIRKIDQMKESNLICGCNFEGNLIDKTNPNHQIGGLIFRAYDGSCSNPGPIIAQAATDISSGLHISDIKLANFFPGGSGSWFADLVLSFRRSNKNSIGASAMERKIPLVLLAQTIDSTTDQVTGCGTAESTAQMTTRFRAQKQPTNMIRLTPGDGSSTAMTARFKDGKVRIFPAISHDFVFNSSGLDTGGPITKNNFYYLYAIPDPLNNDQMQFIASRNPPPLGPAGHPNDHYYITAFRAKTNSGQVYNFIAERDRVHMVYRNSTERVEFRFLNYQKPPHNFPRRATINVPHLPATASSARIETLLEYALASNPPGSATVEVDMEQRFQPRTPVTNVDLSGYRQFLRSGTMANRTNSFFDVAMPQDPNKRVVHETEYAFHDFGCMTCEPGNLEAHAWVHGWTDPHMNQ